MGWKTVWGTAAGWVNGNVLGGKAKSLGPEMCQMRRVQGWEGSRVCPAAGRFGERAGGGVGKIPDPVPEPLLPRRVPELQPDLLGPARPTRERRESRKTFREKATSTPNCSS